MREFRITRRVTRVTDETFVTYADDFGHALRIASDEAPTVPSAPGKPSLPIDVDEDIWEEPEARVLQIEEMG